MSLVHDADEKVYLMGMKYLKIKHLHSALKKSKETDQSEESDQSN